MDTPQLLLRMEQEEKSTAAGLTARSESPKCNINPQAKRILAVLENFGGDWVPLPRILKLFIANYRMRITELRRAGYNIELKDERVDGQRHTAYRLVR
jgi:hypothetical protein